MTNEEFNDLHRKLSLMLENSGLLKHVRLNLTAELPYEGAAFIVIKGDFEAAVYSEPKHD